MEQLQSYVDERLVIDGICIYCGGYADSRDHVPSRVLLDEPYPENLPILPACTQCNNQLSKDEEYFACLVEVARTGAVDYVERSKVKAILNRSPKLTARIASATRVDDQGVTLIQIESGRVRNVALKLARGHAAFELSEIVDHEPTDFRIIHLHAEDVDEIRRFETPSRMRVLPETGCRALQRAIMVRPEHDAITFMDWVDVQEGQYRYRVSSDDNVVIRIVISEYVGFEVTLGIYGD